MTDQSNSNDTPEAKKMRWVFGPSSLVHIPPKIVIQSFITPGQKVTDSIIVEATAVPWHMVTRMLRDDPNILFNIDPRKLEELVAAAYKEAGFDEVILTPRSGDFGRDVIATKKGYVTIRVIDSVKAYKQNHLVNADDVRALLGVLSTDHKATNAVVTTTSDFAPRIWEDPFVSPYIPTRLELLNGKRLYEKITGLSKTIQANIDIASIQVAPNIPLDEQLASRVAKAMRSFGRDGLMQTMKFNGIDHSVLMKALDWLRERGYMERQSWRLTQEGLVFSEWL